MTFARITAWLAALLGAALLGGVAGALVYETVDDEPAAATTTVQGASRTIVQGSADLSDLYKQVAPSVVEITTRSGGAEMPFSPEGGATGTGWMYDDDGHVVTNQHVVDDAESVTVRFDDGRELSARVVGADPSSDVALLQLESREDLPGPLPRGSVDELEIGDPVVAIGSPFGLQGSFTSGIVSGLGRTITAPNRFGIDNVIQTDAALNPGNSGGPLMTLDGAVVGINSQIASSTGSFAGIGYAVPIDTVENVVEQLIEDGTVEHAYLGVQMADSEEGARVVAVLPDSPADEAGFENGDLITEVGGKSVESSTDVRRAVTARRPGDELELTVRRDGKTQKLEAKLADRPNRIGG